MVARLSVSLTKYLLLAIILVLIVNITGLYLLYGDNITSRFLRVDSKVFDELGRESTLKTYPDVDWFKKELAKDGQVGSSTDTNPVQLLAWVMNQVEKADVVYPESAREALEIARAGGGLACGSMSDVYANALLASGYRVRELQLARSLFNNVDTHVTTEILFDGKWIVYDPTFNVSFRKDGRLLGAQEIRASLLDGSASKIEPVFYGEVAYPARLDSYYINYLPLYNALIIIDKQDASIFAKVPPFRYWMGPRTYYLSKTANGLWGVELTKQFYFIFVAVLPIVLVVLALAWLLLFSTTRKRMKMAFNVDKPEEWSALPLGVSKVERASAVANRP